MTLEFIFPLFLNESEFAGLPQFSSPFIVTYALVITFGGLSREVKFIQLHKTRATWFLIVQLCNSRRLFNISQT